MLPSHTCRIFRASTCIQRSQQDNEADLQSNLDLFYRSISFPNHRLVFKPSVLHSITQHSEQAATQDSFSGLVLFYQIPSLHPIPQYDHRKRCHGCVRPGKSCNPTSESGSVHFRPFCTPNWPKFQDLACYLNNHYDYFC